MHSAAASLSSSTPLLLSPSTASTTAPTSSAILFHGQPLPALRLMSLASSPSSSYHPSHTTSEEALDRSKTTTSCALYMRTLPPLTADPQNLKARALASLTLVRPSLASSSTLSLSSPSTAERGALGLALTITHVGTRSCSSTTRCRFLSSSLTSSLSSSSALTAAPLSLRSSLASLQAKPTPEGKS